MVGYVFDLEQLRKHFEENFLHPIVDETVRRMEAAEAARLTEDARRMLDAGGRPAIVVGRLGARSRVVDERDLVDAPVIEEDK